jgi:hypothetical protein
LDGNFARTATVESRIGEGGVLDLHGYGKYAVRVRKEGGKADTLLLILTERDGFGINALEFSGPLRDGAPGS